MKVFRYISFVMLLLVLSCVKEEFPDGAMVATMPYSISVTASNTQLVANGNVSTTVNIVAENITWELTGLPQWLTVSQLKGTGSAALKVTATEHKSGDDSRVATFSIKSTTPRYEFSRNITITQGTATKYVNSAGILTLAAKEATTDVAVESNYNWTAECDSPWVKLVKTDNANLQVTVSENTSSTRTATVMFKAADSTSAIATIIITQSEAGVTGSTANVAFGLEGGTKTVDINAEVSWSAYTSATSWISVSPESGEGGEHSLSITALANNSTTPRSGYVYVMIGTDQKLAIPVSQEALSFHVNGTLQSFAANGTMTQKMQVVSKKSWEVQSCPTWLTVSPSSGGNGTSEISVTAAENRSLNSRSGTLRIGVKGMNLYKEFTVTQNSMVTDFEQTMLEFGWEEEEKDLKIELPNSWGASVSEDWFSMSQYSGNGGETVVVSVKTNDSDDPRTGTIIVVTEGKSLKITVTQQGQYLTINSTAGEVPAMGNSINLSISTTVGAVESIEYDGTSKDWLSFKKNGNGSYTLVAVYNPSTKNRTARFVIKPTMSTTNAACTAGVKFNVTQKGRALSASTDEIVLFMDGETSSTYSIIADGGYTISKPETDDWYTLKHDSVSRTFCIEVTENSDGVGRESQITMSLTGLPLGEELSSVIKVKLMDIYNGHDYVDLGLPSGIMWATCNVGATKPEEYGGYYAWGETAEKEDYSEGYSSTYNKSMSDISGNETYDVARATWGGNWRMPTSTELEELINNCTWKNTTLNGVEGRQVTGRNGNSIFLPYAGYKYSIDINYEGLFGIYWSSTPNGDQEANHLDFNSDTEELDGFGLNRYDGLTIRPVCNVSVSGTKYTISVKSEGNGRVEVEGYNTEAAQIEIGSTVTVVATPDNGYRFEGWYLNAGTGTDCVSSDNPYTFTVTEDVQLIARFVAGGQANNLHNGHEYVDLGLPSGTKWATCNVGAATPEGYGGYYAWGEIEEKEDYSWETYKWCDGSQTTLTKYCTSSSWGTVDNKTVLDLEDDVAHVKWGGSWRMPSLNEMKELYNNCNWAVINQNGTKCYKVTSRINGNSILLPLGGRYFGKQIIDKEVDAQLSTNTLSPTYSYNIYCPDLSTGNLDWDRDLRSYGFSVRPVCNLSVSGTKYTISVKSEGNGRVEVEGYNTESAQIEIGSTVTVVATPDNGYRFEGWYLNAGTGTDCVSYDNSYTFTVTKDVQLIARFVAGGQANNLHNGHEYVDLGLPSGTKWATCNVGAATPEGYGGYYAWGETEEKEDYSWETYKWCNGSQTTLTKYCTSSSWGTVDNKTVLDLEDDVAHVKWGGKWRMPTDTEQDELRDKCTWTWITQNGVVGRKVTGPSGKSIFLPAAGSYFGVEIKEEGDFGRYRASTFFSAYNYCAYQFIFDDYSITWNRDSYRCSGLSVRPVYK